MFYIYVLKSLKNQKRYVGYTGKIPTERLSEHNRGANNWTGRNGPFELVYCEELENKGEAFKREKFLKSGQGRKFLDQLLNK